MATVKPIDEVRTNLTRMESEFAKSLPKHINPKKFTNVVVTALQKDKDLLSCNRQSLYNACMTCAQDGLIPDGREAALVKFKQQVAYMPMVAGLLKKIRNSGEIGMIHAEVVYHADEYESWIDENGPHFKHKKKLTDRGKPTLTYAYAKTRDGFLYFEEISEDDMAKIKKAAKSDKVWSGPFQDEMRRKSAIRRLSKRLPMDTDALNLVERDDQFYDLDDTKETTKEEAPKEKSSLEDIVTEQTVDDAPADDNVEDAEFTEEDGKLWETEGIIDDLKVAELPDKKQKYGGRLNKLYYTTFKKDHYDIMVKSADEKVPVKITFEEAAANGKKQYLVTNIELIKQAENASVPI